jgi:hypothetical protein
MDHGQWTGAARWCRRFVLPWALLLAGCNRSDADDAAEKADRSLRSWSETVRLGGEQWATDRIPPTYLRQILDATNEGLDEQATTLKKKLPATDFRRQDLERRAASVRDRAKRLSDALEGHPKPTTSNTARAPSSADDGRSPS